MNSPRPPEEACDPYAVLGVDPEADDATLRRAYHDRLRAGGATAELNAAWVQVRDPAARAHHPWRSVTALVALPPASTGATGADLDLESLIRELASAGDWELGEPL